ncbi:5-methylcytosine restriction system specificity protein McrC [Secundilactobacillus yichangensis]|uniref:5-methylcytosine restriction system specificity protein McrC n=1 Tax=Secundilactobacillus yichangensis TaxID=2799580 RepID=UPI001943C900|nr:hypothetical protein [Secundilactobacillus yichangensis]
MKIKLKDNQPLPAEYLKKKFIKEICDQNLTQLSEAGILTFPQSLAVSADLSEQDSYVLTHYKGRLWTTNLVGTVTLGGKRKTNQILIGSRADTPGNDYFLKYMLYRVLHVNFLGSKDFDVGPVSGVNVLALFIPELLNRALRAGLYKSYMDKKFNDYQIHGQLDFKRQLKSDVPFVGRFASQSHEFTYDTKVLELVRHAIEAMRADSQLRGLLSVDKSIRQNVRTVVENTPRYRTQERSELLRQNKVMRIRNNYYAEYRPLLRVCRAFLEGKSLTQTKGAKFNGVLIDIAWLFEEYVGRLLEPGYVHSHNRAGEDKQYLFRNEKDKGLIYPDYLKRGKPQIPLDAKYKFTANIASHDRLQMLAYMLRFQSKRGMLIHLADNNEANVVELPVEGEYADETERPVLVEYGIAVPRVDDWAEFVEGMRVQEKKLKDYAVGFSD